MLIKLNELIQTVKQTGSNQFSGSKPIPIGSIFDVLLEKNDSTRCCDDEDGARKQVISSMMNRKWTNEKQGEVMVNLIFKVLQEEPKFSKIVMTNDKTTLELKRDRELREELNTMRLNNPDVEYVIFRGKTVQKSYRDAVRDGSVWPAGATGPPERR